MRAQQLENASGAASAGGARLCERVYRCEAPALGFAWHPSQHSRMLLLLQGPRRGNTVDHDLALKDLCLLPPTPLAWSPADELLYASSGDAAPNRRPSGCVGSEHTRLEPTRRAAAAGAPSGDLTCICAPKTRDNKGQNACIQSNLAMISRV